VIFNLPLDRYIKFDIINMEFEIIFYKNSSGSSPVEEALDRLKVTNIILWRQALKGIEKIKNREYHKEPLSKYLESGLWELRVKSGTGILRIIYTFKKGQIIILLHLFVKKKQELLGKESFFSANIRNNAMFNTTEMIINDVETIELDNLIEGLR